MAAYGTEGIEKDIYLEDMQLHLEDTDDTPEEFRQRFPSWDVAGHCPKHSSRSPRRF
jgi:hypothetical protein